MLGRRSMFYVLAATQMLLAIAAGHSFAQPLRPSVTSCGGTGAVMINEFLPAPSAGI